VKWGTTVRFALLSGRAMEGSFAYVQSSGFGHRVDEDLCGDWRCPAGVMAGFPAA
jgi:hypothetical protein